MSPDRRPIIPADATFLSAFSDGRIQALVLDGSPKEQDGIKAAVRDSVGRMETKKVLDQVSKVLQTCKYPWLAKTRQTTVALLPTITEAPTSDAQRISAEQWYRLYAETVSTTEVPVTIPTLLEVARILAPVMLQNEDGTVNADRIQGVKKVWIGMLKGLPSESLTPDMRDILQEGMSRVYRAAAGEPVEAWDLLAPEPLPAPEDTSQTKDNRTKLASKRIKPKVKNQAKKIKSVKKASHTAETIPVFSDGTLGSDRDAHLSRLQLRMLHVLGTAKKPLNEAEFYQEVTGKDQLPGYAREILATSLARLRIMLTTVSEAPTKKATKGYARFIPLPSGADPTYRLENVILSFPKGRKATIFTSEGHVMPLKK